MNKIKKIIMAVAVAIVGGIGLIPQAAFADMEFSVTPMRQKIVLMPGEKYEGTFGIVNPSSNTSDFYYKLSVEPFYVDENYQPVYENNGDYNQIVDWITLDSETGVIKPNSTKYVNFIVDVPSNAPAGGQYAIIRVASDRETSQSGDDTSVNIQNVMTIAHVIYAEVAGETKRSGEVLEANVPSFLLSGNIAGTSAVKNTGNVHGTAKYTLQVFPLFSSEEIYTNEEEPEEKTILPNRTLYNETVWAETPAVGIFNVIYTVEFEGETMQVSKMVIICPIWLLFLIIFVIIAAIIWIVMRVRARGKKSRRPAAPTAPAE